MLAPVLTSLLVQAVASSTPAAPGDLGPLLEPVRAEHGVPAVGALVWAGGSVRAVGATGLRRAGGDERVTAEDRWHLGACSQAVTTTLYAALVARRELRWQTTLGEAFADLREDMFPAYRDLPLEHVLAHRAGLAFLPRRALREALETSGAAPPMQRRRVVEDALRRPPAYPPGTRTTYSQVGYTVVGSAIESLVGQPYEILLQREVFDVLGMASAGLGAPGNALYVDEPWGHLATAAGPEPVPPGPDADVPSAFAPASSVHCTLRDAAKLAALHLALVRGDDRPPFATGVAEISNDPDREGPYALGWIVAEPESDVGRVLAHSGGNGRWYASFTLLPEKNVAVVVTCNQGGRAGAAACRDVASELLKAWLDESPPRTQLIPSGTAAGPG